MVNSLLPLDSFVVINKGVFSSYDQLSLTVLYQPVIGTLSVSLYSLYFFLLSFFYMPFFLQGLIY